MLVIGLRELQEASRKSNNRSLADNYIP
jgi:hypothetical protein